MSSNADLNDIILHMQHFTWADYLLFIFMLILCILIGIYFGFMHKSNTEAEYLMGGRNMLVFPVALSLIASFISGITLVSLPTEVYSYGIQYLYVIFGVVVMGFIMGFIYLPVFHNLNITSTYEYLESRFNRNLRMFGSIMFVIMNLGYLPIVIYVPALAFNQVTGINIHVITPIVCLICVFYTCVGGIKAVVATDVVQTFSMFGALILVAVKGTMDLGKDVSVFEKAWTSERIEAPIFDINPTIRHSLWSQLIGGAVYWLQTNAVSQNMIQRYLALPTLKAGRRALWIFVVGVSILMCICAYNGLLIYATYEHCDPLTTKLARRKDQLFPLFVMHTLHELPGLTGLFVAGVFSAALSSLSTCLNSMSAVVLEDFVKPFVKQPLTEQTINWIMRLVVVGVGVFCLCLVFLVEKMGSTVLQLTMSLEAITNGPLLGIFTIGILLPWIGSKCALFGGIVGVVVMSWISLNAQAAIASGALSFDHKPMKVDDCHYNIGNITSSTINSAATMSSDDIFPLYKISYMWYTALGAVVAILVAIASTAVFGKNNPRDVPKELMAPFVRKIVFKDDTDVVKSSATSNTQSGKASTSNAESRL
ncbi:sodium-coupled monocarboxylate transporter 1 [Culicoides brevitarsis]|uniref:sodium-coupled monocarboxylate transporter 1 n=1 Tax=Culicoides brevitarsis TaxID=469753 RepID=UPI00307BBF49